MDKDTIINQLKKRKPRILGEDTLRKSAVLLPLVETNNETHILFEKRAMHMRRQPGDICFPGGRIDKEDTNPAACAIRETTEELGIPATSITSLVPLDYLVFDMGRMIYPYVGIINHPEEIIPNKEEVGEVFTVPLEFLLNTEPEIHKIHLQVIPDEKFPLDLIIGGENYQWQMRQIDELFYQYEGKVIWGLTAKILHHFITLIR
ncbi:CoA pyrophosphatase [Oceanobacillus piezotolerans]|uniref:CoA pyrophosphatase n=1 Tax=Oceanobacillus piezotolerans TaxID=2448030 RepID=A0A498DJZ1_9BACI|nr:CoA pyrophosphatase [Oceanobacillus piezotolerans]RLL42745.1 CoA pyrophosphatase [Oceanobacillus piezotolerans]